MKVAQVVAVYPPKRGGIGTVAYTYAEGLRQRGHEVRVFTPTEATRFRWGHAAFMPQLFFSLRRFDVIHLHYPFYGAAIFVALAARCWRVPLVATYHMKTKAAGWLGKVFAWHRRFLEPFILGSAEKIFVSSLDYAKSIHLPYANLEELPFGVDVARFAPGDGSFVRQAWGIDQEEMVILFVGGLDDAHYFKGVDILLQAVSELPPEARWRCLVVGGGNRLEDFEKQTKEMGISDRVHFVGRKGDEELPFYYRAADVHVLPSTDRSEAFGLVTLEAAASGTLSLVSDLPGARTLIDPQKTGYLLIPGSTSSLRQVLLFLLEKPELRAAMGRSARQRAVECYGGDVLLERLIEMYKVVKVRI